jgi:hypothetical protein
MTDGKAGRPKFAPTDKQRAAVTAWTGSGLTHKSIATALKIDNRTLLKHFGHELEDGFDKCYAVVVGKLWQLIDGNDRAAIFFWLKTRAGWRETNKVGLGGDNQTKVLNSLSNAQLDELLAALEASGLEPTQH